LSAASILIAGQLMEAEALLSCSRLEVMWEYKALFFHQNGLT
jgi:hypothetical protein